MISRWTIVTLVRISLGVFHADNFFVAGQCIDKNEYCSYWASVGECTKSPRYMLQNCQESCRVCIACFNIYNDVYCQMHHENCWIPPHANDLLNNCRKTCETCTCCPTKPVTAKPTDTTTALLNVSTAAQTTAVTTLNSTTTEERRKTTQSVSGTEANTKFPQTTRRSSNTTNQDFGVTDPNGLSTELLAGVIAGVVAVIGVLGLLLFWFWRKRRLGSLNQPKRPSLPQVQYDVKLTEEITWLERQPRRNSNSTPDTSFNRVLEEPDCSVTIRKKTSVHYENASELLRADSDLYEEPVLQDTRATMGLSEKARENDSVYEAANPEGLYTVATSNKTLDNNDEYCGIYTAVGQNVSVKVGENRSQEAPNTEDPNYDVLEGPNTEYQALQGTPAKNLYYTPMEGQTEINSYQPLANSARPAYQPLKKTNKPPRKALLKKRK